MLFSRCILLALAAGLLCVPLRPVHARIHRIADQLEDAGASGSTTESGVTLPNLPLQFTADLVIVAHLLDRVRIDLDL